MRIIITAGSYVTVAMSTSPPIFSPSLSLLALEARWKASSFLVWKASSLLATGSGLVFFGMLTCDEPKEFFGMLAWVVCRRRRGGGGGGGGGRGGVGQVWGQCTRWRASCASSLLEVDVVLLVIMQRQVLAVRCHRFSSSTSRWCLRFSSS